MSQIFDILKILALHSIFIITAFIFTANLILTVFSAISLRKYLRKNSYVDYNSIVASPITPTLSVIAPAYNESRTIIDNIRTMLSLYYNNYEVIVVNDGSKDGTLEKIIDAYELEKVNYYFDYRLPCKRIRGVYKSQNRSFKKLTVIDKVNGGKADSLNAGLNVSKNDLIVSIDADSIMEPDALLKLVKPFLESKDKQVIAAGGVIRIANSCEISGGHIKKIHLPKKFLPRAQVMEYTRAFLLGRMAWSELDGLLLISGALGMFNREVVIQAGGYSTETVGEDMELVVRIRRYMAENNLPYDVVYIPDPLCWTEVPEDLKTLAKQRSRWTRGTLETLITHRKLFFNKKYGKLGLLGYPYWLIFEWLSPIIEFCGMLWFILLVILGKLNWPFFLLLFGFVYFFAVSLSIWAVVFEEITFHRYEKRRDVLKLIAVAFAEPIFFHPLATMMNIKGNIDKIIGKNIWGKMERKGFSLADSQVLPSVSYPESEPKIVSEKRTYRSGPVSHDPHARQHRIRRITLYAAAACIAAALIIIPVKTGYFSKTGQDTGTRDIFEAKETRVPVIELETESHPAIQYETPVTGTYHIIVGSFKDFGNARELRGILLAKGYPVRILATENAFFRVSASQSSAREEAFRMVADMRSRGFESAWICFR